MTTIFDSSESITNASCTKVDCGDTILLTTLDASGGKDTGLLLWETFASPRFNAIAPGTLSSLFFRSTIAGESFQNTWDCVRSGSEDHLSIQGSAAFPSLP